jgi:hypothetical protein
MLKSSELFRVGGSHPSPGLAATLSPAGGEGVLIFLVLPSPPFRGRAWELGVSSLGKGDRGRHPELPNTKINFQNDQAGKPLTLAPFAARSFLPQFPQPAEELCRVRNGLIHNWDSIAGRS